MIGAPLPRLSQVNLVVDDLDETVRFLRALGFAVNRPDFPHLEVDFGHGVTLEFDGRESVAQWNAGVPEALGGSAVITFQLATAEAVDQLWWRVVDAGFGSAQPPMDAFWGARWAIVVDADGNQFGLMGPRERAEGRRAP